MAVRDMLRTLKVLYDAGLAAPARPDRLVRSGLAFRRFGLSLAAGFAATAARYPDRLCVVDERGTLTWSELDRRSNALARGLRAAGVREDDLVGMMCRNHRGFLETTAALAKLGTHCVFLNTAFAGPQLREVLARERPVALIYDDEFADLLDVEHTGIDRRFVAWQEQPGEVPALDEVIAAHSDAPVDAPSTAARTIILTSGTTGTPKGAARDKISSAAPAIAMLERIPYRNGDVMVIAAPLFHSWGFGNVTIGLVIGGTFVLARHFDPEQTLALVARHRATCLAAVPVMLQRILDLPAEVRRRYDVSSLRIVPLSGSAIPAGLATRWMDEFGDNLYNLYGSTEVGWVTIATPAELRAEPGTAGTPPHGTVVKVLDAEGHEVPSGQTGRIFVGSDLLFDGYTGGGSKEVVDGLMSTGDTGHFDEHGHLFVEGRDDEMIVSGGENVFPREVEDLLAEHPDVADVAVVGVPDDEFGQRLAAFVVRREGAELTADDVRAYVHDHLARFKVPRDVTFVDQLPRNPTGKILKRLLT